MTQDTPPSSDLQDGFSAYCFAHARRYAAKHPSRAPDNLFNRQLRSGNALDDAVQDRLPLQKFVDQYSYDRLRYLETRHRPVTDWSQAKFKLAEAELRFDAERRKYPCDPLELVKAWAKFVLAQRDLRSEMKRAPTDDDLNKIVAQWRPHDRAIRQTKIKVVRQPPRRKPLTRSVPWDNN